MIHPNITAKPHIVIAGVNRANLSEIKKNKNYYNFPPKLPYDTFYSSFSIYSSHSVIVMSDGTAYALGDNTSKKILGSLPQKVNEWTQINIKYGQTNSLPLVSAVCGQSYTLYHSLYDEQHILAYVYQDKNEGVPLFLNIEDRTILKIYGGRNNSAAIDENGCVIIIKKSIFDEDSHNLPIILSLPDNEKAIQVACLNNQYFVLSMNGDIYQTDIQEGNSLHIFQKVQFSYRFKQISGTSDHCIAITTDGNAFGHGKNHFGHLGEQRFKSDVENFMNLSNFNQNIKEVSAGAFHTLALDMDGTVEACGRNQFDELMVSKGSCKSVNKPQKVDLKNVSYCIAGLSLSAFFINCPIPPNSPNLHANIDDASNHHYFKMSKAELIGKLAQTVQKFQKQFQDHNLNISKIDEMTERLSKKLVECDNKILSIYQKLSRNLNSNENDDVEKDLDENQIQKEKENEKGKIRKQTKDDIEYDEDSDEDQIQKEKEKIKIRKQTKDDIEYDEDSDEDQIQKENEKIKIRKQTKDDIEYDEDSDEDQFLKEKVKIRKQTKDDIEYDEDSDEDQFLKEKVKTQKQTKDDIEYDEDSDEDQIQKDKNEALDFDYDDDSDVDVNEEDYFDD